MPRVFAAREMLEARDPADLLAARGCRASRRLRNVAAFPDGRIAVVEQTAERAEARAGAGEHTNHYLQAELVALGAPPSVTSLSRLAPPRPPARGPPARAEAAELRRRSRRHDAEPEPVCAHAPDPADPQGTVILYAFVADVERRRLWVCEGPPRSGGVRRA